MLKVFLVEDEVIMRNGIRENIPWAEKGFVFAGEASDGEMAYLMIKKCRPDIVITDIKMPFMDGLELSSIIKKELPDTKVIILSGYNEFDFAKQAIGIGVTDYLLKPISLTKLLEAVERVADMIRAEQRQKEMLKKYEEEQEERLEVEKSRLFTGIINHVLSTSQILERGHELGIEFSAGCYNIILMKLLTEETERDKLIQYSDDLVSGTEEMNHYLKKARNIIAIDREAEGWILVIKAETKAALAKIQEELKWATQEIMSKYDPVGYFCGVGKPVERLQELSESYREAGKAFASRFFMKPNQVVCYKDVEGMHGRENDELHLKMVDSAQFDRQMIHNFLASGTIEEVSDFIEELFRGMKSEQYKSQILRQYIAVDMYFGVTAFLEKMGKTSEDLEDEYGDAREMAEQLKSVERMKSYLVGLLCEAIKIRDKKVANQYTMILERAKEYIGRNFQHREMSLNTVAAHVNISPSYFSTLFRQETGQTFVEYITSLRLEKAKELLMCTGMKTSEIGYEVGYGDSHYFSYIFKKIQGCTPKEYRMRRKV